MFVRLIFRCGRCRRLCSVNAHWKDRQLAFIACPYCAELYFLPYDPRRADKPHYVLEIHRIAAKHKVGLATACSIREGIMSPEQAKVPLATVAGGTRVNIPLGKRVMTGAVLVLAALVVVVLPWPRANVPLAVEETPPPAVPIIHVNAAGGVTRVWGLDPRSVLVALCDHHETRTKIMPAFIAPGHPPGSGTRVGLVRDLVHSGAFQAVRIRRDGRTGRWYAGNGRDPIALERLETIPPGAEPV